MSTPFLIFIGLMLVAMFIFNSRARKRMAEQEKKAEERRKEMMVPGAWVRLRSGFWGRFVDLDGDIVVLETTDGHEMYWEREMIAEIGAVPPLAENADNETQESADVEEPADEDDTVLGLDESARDGSGASEPDEQQK